MATPQEYSSPSPDSLTMRPAAKRDADTIHHLIENSTYSHTHIDWFAPEDWLGEPGFLLCHEDASPVGCLAITPEPAPAAWVRVAAIKRRGFNRRRALVVFEKMFEEIRPILQQQSVTDIGWMSHRQWANPWLPVIGFETINTVITFQKEDLEHPTTPQTACHIRPVLPEDMYRLAAIEKRAYDPLWRHSTRGLHRAWHHALSFDVILVDGRVVGFQHSTRTQRNGAHLARLTIDPDHQGRGLGTILLAHAIHSYRKAGVDNITLNTQTDNIVSQKLYRKFGFERSRYEVQLWSCSLP